MRRILALMERTQNTDTWSMVEGTKGAIAIVLFGFLSCSRVDEMFTLIYNLA
jgi:hypothetical protein